MSSNFDCCSWEVNYQLCRSFFSTAFKISFCCSEFYSSSTTCLSVDFFSFILLGIHWAFWTQVLVSFINSFSSSSVFSLPLSPSEILMSTLEICTLSSVCLNFLTCPSFSVFLFYFPYNFFKYISEFNNSDFCCA